MNDLVDRLVWVRPPRATSDHRVAGRRDERARCGAAIGRDALWATKARRPCSTCTEIVRKELLSEYIERLLEAMNRPLKMEMYHSWLKLGRSDFDGAMPYSSDFYELLPYDEGLIYTGFEPKELPWPIDIRTIVNDDDVPGELVVGLYRGLRAPEIRGRVAAPVLPYPTLDASWFLRDGSGQSTIMGLARPRRWVCIANKAVRSPEKDAEHSRRLQLSLGLVALHRTRWHVRLAHEDGLAIKFPTDPIGAREVFRLRDLPDGRARRAALRHWVTEHWRLDTRDPGQEVQVREHLRGTTRFHWSGLGCRITPSDEDYTREYAAIIARELARIEGTDHRPLEATSLGGHP